MAANFLGLPGFFLAVGALALASNARALCKWAISRSMLARMSESPMAPPIDTGDYFISMAIVGWP